MFRCWLTTSTFPSPFMTTPPALCVFIIHFSLSYAASSASDVAAGLQFILRNKGPDYRAGLRPYRMSTENDIEDGWFDMATAAPETAVKVPSALMT